MNASQASQSRQMFQNLGRLIGQRARLSASITLVLATGLGIGTGAAQPSNYYGGLLNTALGNATLQVNSSSGALVVSGIGSSGNDGVQIATGGGGGATLNLGVFNPAVLPAGGSLHVAFIGRSDGIIQQINLQSAVGGSGAIFADFTGLGAPAVRVALYSNDTLVAFADGIPPSTALATFTTAGTPHGGGLPMIISPCILNPEACYGNVDFTLSVPDPTGPNGSIITIPGQGPMFCTRMQITPGYPTPYFVPTYQVKATTITGVDLGTVYIEHEGYVYIEHEGHPGAAIENNALGQAQYNFSNPGVLRVNNLGHGGADRVDVELRNANTFRGDMVELNPQPLPPGNTPMLLTMSATGTLAGGAGEQTLGMLRLLNQETNLALSADLSAAGSATVSAELWQGCSLVSSYTVPNGGLLLTSAQGGSSVSVGYDPGDDPCGTTPPLPPWWWWVTWPGPVQLTTPTGPVMADRVRVAPETGTPSLVTLTHVTFQMAGPQTLDFTGESGLRLGLDFDGNQHFPLGQATLGITATGQLNLGNLGPLQTDGMEIPTGRSDWIAIAAASLSLPPYIPTITSYEFHAMLDNVRDRVASRVTTTVNAAGETQVTGDMSPLGATHYRMLVLAHGTTLSVLDLTNQPVATFNEVTYNHSHGVAFRSLGGYYSYLRIKLLTNPGDPSPVIQFSPTLTVSGDEVIIMPEDAVRYPGPQNRLLITGSGTNLFQFNCEELGLFGNGHTGLGSATLVADTEMLTVGHLGSSGNNGVSINLNNALNALVRFAPLNAPAGQVVVRQFAGTFIHELGHNLGTAHFGSTAAGGVVQVTADFSPVGASNVTVEVRSAGQLVQRIAGLTGNIGTVSAWPTGLGEQSTGSPTGAPGCTAPFGQLVQFTINGGPTLQGDELRVFPENPSQAIGNLQMLNLVASGFDSFTVTNETVTPALTPTIAGISQSFGTNVVLSVPTAFGYDYTLDTVDALGPQPVPWAPVSSFFGDGSVQQITVPANKPQQFFRVRVH